MSAAEAYTGDPDVDTLLFSWGRVIANAQGWERGFALSIQRDRHKPGWRPSHKQFAVMEKLVRNTPPPVAAGIYPADDLPDDVAVIDFED